MGDLKSSLGRRSNLFTENGERLNVFANSQRSKFEKKERCSHDFKEKDGHVWRPFMDEDRLVWVRI